MQTIHTPEIPYIPYRDEHIEQRAEKLYNTYRNKHPHNTPALNVQQLTYDLGGKIWLNPDVNRALNTPELDINDYALNLETQQWENINFNSYIPYLTLHEQKTSTIENVFTRFRLAHNLGHLYLHVLNNKTTIPPDSYNKTPSSLQEREANRFAAALLMPKTPFTHHRKNTANGDIIELSKLFKTGTIYTEIRAKQLGLID
jgi:hypothetical protein